MDGSIHIGGMLTDEKGQALSRQVLDVLNETWHGSIWMDGRLEADAAHVGQRDPFAWARMPLR
jgi:meiotically up-regulated gene 157 (Mug157) protein